MLNAPMSYELIWERKGVVRRFYGDVTIGNLIKASDEVQGDLRFDELRYVISDFTDCTKFVFDGSEVEELAATDGAAAYNNRQIKSAVVVTLPEAVAAARYYEKSPLNAYPTRIFSTLEDARAWLGMPK